MPNSSHGKKLLLACSGMLAVTVPIVFGMLNASLIRAQSQRPDASPKFEVASIRSCADAGGGGRGGGGGGFAVSSPGTLRLNCSTVAELITAAYVRFANGQRNNFFFGRSVGGPMGRTTVAAIEGGPAWINSERYDINAKAEGTPRYEIKLKIHRETKAVPVYALTVTKSSPKLQQFKEGSCVPGDLTAQTPPASNPKPSCGTVGIGKKGPNLTVSAFGMSLSEFFNVLSVNLGRPVVDKTGIKGRFDFHLEFAPDESTPGFLPPGGGPDGAPGATPSDHAGGPTIFTAIQEQLGLKLERANDPSEFLVIDHIEKPSAN